MNSAMDEIQSAQDDEYEFPYHYVAQRTERGVRVAHSWRWGFRYITTLEYLLGKMRALRFESVGDVGCGDGRFIAEVARAFPGTRTLGIDYSARAVAMARAMNPDGSYACVDVTREKLADGFDLLTSIEVLEHIPPPTLPKFVGGMRRLAKPGSRLLLTVPHVNQPLARKHYQHFDARSLEEALRPHFQVAELEYIDRRSRLFALWERAAVNKHFIVANERILGSVESLYMRYMFPATADTGMRMLAVCDVL